MWLLRSSLRKEVEAGKPTRDGILLGKSSVFWAQNQQEICCELLVMFCAPSKLDVSWAAVAEPHLGCTGGQCVVQMKIDLLAVIRMMSLQRAASSGAEMLRWKKQKGLARGAHSNPIQGTFHQHSPLWDIESCFTLELRYGKSIWLLDLATNESIHQAESFEVGSVWRCHSISVRAASQHAVPLTAPAAARAAGTFWWPSDAPGHISVSARDTGVSCRGLEPEMLRLLRALHRIFCFGGFGVGGKQKGFKSLYLENSRIYSCDDLYWAYLGVIWRP